MYQLPIELEARNPARNVHRFYRIWMERDLFNTLLVCTQYGRMGTHGRVKEYEVADEEAARGLIARHLTKRQSSLKRIGARYTLSSLAFETT